MRIILFGAGGFLSNVKERIDKLPNTEIIQIIDNNPAIVGKKVMNIMVSSIDDMDEDADYVVITSNFATEIAQQIAACGVPANKIKRFSEYEAIAKREDKKIYGNGETTGKESIAAITPVLEFNGACLAIIYLLEELRKTYGYSVTLVASREFDETVEFILAKGINIIIDPEIEYVKTDIHDAFDYYIVNTFLARKCLQYLNPKKTIWWLHESESSYQIEEAIWNDFENYNRKDLNVVCVSEKALDTFTKFYPSLSPNIIEYGIPDDFNLRQANLEEKTNRIVFAVIGFIAEIKGQDVLIDAISSLTDDYKKKCEVWIIGENDDNKYFDLLSGKIALDNVVFKGGMSHDELKRIYKNIDVVVSPSRQDSLPIVITEAFMNKKICIISDTIGTAKYVKDGKQALVFKSGDSKDLADKIRYVIDHYSSFGQMVDAGRKIYETYFSMEQVGKKFSNLIEKMGN